MIAVSVNDSTYKIEYECINSNADRAISVRECNCMNWIVATNIKSFVRQHKINFFVQVFYTAVSRCQQGNQFNHTHQKQKLNLLKTKRSMPQCNATWLLISVPIFLFHFLHLHSHIFTLKAPYLSLSLALYILVLIQQQFTPRTYLMLSMLIMKRTKYWWLDITGHDTLQMYPRVCASVCVCACVYECFGCLSSQLNAMENTLWLMFHLMKTYRLKTARFARFRANEEETIMAWR